MEIRYGDYEPPQLPVIADVKASFGARGDGVSDDTAAFELAIATIARKGTLLLPKGVYVITRVRCASRMRRSWRAVGVRTHLRCAGSRCLLSCSTAALLHCEMKSATHSSLFPQRLHISTQIFCPCVGAGK